MQVLLDKLFFNVNLSFIDIVSKTNVIPNFKRWPSNLNYPDCRRLLTDIDYSEKVRKNRITLLNETDYLVESCDDFYSRSYYPVNPLNHEEAEFPIAFANTVYKV